MRKTIHEMIEPRPNIIINMGRSGHKRDLLEQWKGDSFLTCCISDVMVLSYRNTVPECKSKLRNKSALQILTFSVVYFETCT